MRTYVRCRSCEARKTLAKHPDEYVRRLPACHNCGRSENTWRSVKKYRQPTCNCMGYHFPHKLGTGWCDHNPRNAGKERW